MSREASVRTLLQRVLVVLVGAVLAFAVLTWWALEWSGVAVVQTTTPDGTPRSTHVWYAEPDGELWLEAGTPENPWFRDVLLDPLVVFDAGDGPSTYRAEPIEHPSGHETIRSLLRARYGVRDWWVGLLVDTSSSVAVRLVPAAPRPSG